jgi:hypothetical protein
LFHNFKNYVIWGVIFGHGAGGYSETPLTSDVANLPFVIYAVVSNPIIIKIFSFKI